MARSKKTKTVVVDEPVQATQPVEEQATAWIATEAWELTPEESVATVVEGEITTAETIQPENLEGTTTINTAEALDARKEAAEKPEEEKKPEEELGEKGETAEDKAAVERLIAKERQNRAAVVAANNAPIRQIPSRVITDPFGKKTTIYQPQVVRKVYKDSNVKNAAVWVNARRGEIVKEDEMLKKD